MKSRVQFKFPTLNENAVKSLNASEFCPHMRKNPLVANQKRRYIEKYVNIIYELGSAHVKFAVWIEVDLVLSIWQSRPKYKSAVPNCFIRQT